MRNNIAFAVRLLALMVVFCAGGRVWADTETVNGITWTYTVSNGGASVGAYANTAIPMSTAGAITIPSTLGGYRVTSIGYEAFAWCSGLTSVTIPDSVTNIGHYAFSSCSGLTSVTIGNDVTSIGNSAFRSCSGLTSITIPDSVTSIGYEAFAWCSGLTSVTIPDSVTSIGDHAFEGCSGLTSITIPASVTSIGDYAFEGCDGLTSVTIPASVTSIGYEAFYGCRGLTSVTIPDSVTSIGAWAFYGCSGLVSMTIPDGVTSIGWHAFSDCSGLTSVSIPASVTYSVNEAFSGCNNIHDATLPGCKCFELWNVTNLVISAGTKEIPDYAFPDYYGAASPYENYSVKCVTIPDSVTSIGEEAFRAFCALESLMIPSSVTNIGRGAFYECSSLSCISFAGDAPVVGAYALPCRVVRVPVGAKGYDIDENGRWNGACVEYYDAATGETFQPECWVDYKIDSEGLLYGIELHGATEIVVPDEVTSITSGVFCWKSRVTSIIIPDSVNSMDGWFAFSNCASLERVVLPSAIELGIYDVTYESFGDEAGGPRSALFVNCPSLKDVTFPGKYLPGPSWTHWGDINDTVYGSMQLLCGDSCEGITNVTLNGQFDTIPEYAFRGCSALESITILDDISSIELSAFDGCSNLSSIKLTGDAPTVGSFAFFGVAEGCVVRVPAGAKGYDLDEDGKWNGLRVEYYVNNISWGNTDSGATVYDDERVINESNFDFKIPATKDLPKGAKIKINKITLLSLNDTFTEWDKEGKKSDPSHVRLNGIDSDDCVFGGEAGNHTLTYTFSTPCYVIVGRSYKAVEGNDIGGVGDGLALVHSNGSLLFGDYEDRASVRYLKTDDQDSIISTVTAASIAGESGWNPAYEIDAEIVELEPSAFESLSLEYTATFSNHTITPISGGWFNGSTGFDGATPQNTDLRIGPSSVYDQALHTGESYLPWKGVAAREHMFSLALYADVSAMPTTSNAVMVALGNGAVNSVILYRDGDEVSLSFVDNVGGIIGNATASVAVKGGYHLYCVTCDPEAGDLSLSLDGEEAPTASVGREVQLANGFQIGSVYSCIPGGNFCYGKNMAIVKLLGYDALLSAADIRVLSAEYPAVETRVCELGTIQKADTTVTIVAGQTVTVDVDATNLGRLVVNGGVAKIRVTDLQNDAGCSTTFAVEVFNGGSIVFVEADGSEISSDRVVVEDDDGVCIYALNPDKLAIRNVTARQRRPWNGKVDIKYTLLMGEKASQCLDGNVALKITATDNATGETYVADASALSGDTGTAAGAHHIVWDLNAQGLELNLEDIVFSVAYAEPSLYCVIDLSAGANAASYPVYYLADIPEGGWTDEYKTTKLVLRRIEPGDIHTRDARITKPFYIGVFEVTQKQYELVMGTNPSQYKGDMRPVEQVSYNMIRGSSNGAQWPASSEVDLDSFIGRLRAKTGIEEFDLPTEAQWEYACRAGTTSKYNNGGDFVDDLKALGRYNGNTSDGKGGYSQQTTVGSYLPNAWGLYDMHGNVWEICLDWYGNQFSGNDPVGPSSGSMRVFRGGSWRNDANTSSSQIRGTSYAYSTSNDFGFRLVRTLSNTNSEHSPEAVAGAERADALCSAEAALVAIDSRMRPVVESSIVLSWDASWIGDDPNATVVILDNGEEVKRETGAGEFEYALTGPARHDLVYKTIVDDIEQEEKYSATVYWKWKYDIDDDDNAIITATTQTEGDITIHSEIDGYRVVGIAERVFEGCDKLTNVTILEGITAIGDYAFSGCSGLTSITIPDSVTSIGSGAFQDCSALTTVVIPHSVTSIGDYAFGMCRWLEDITIGYGVTSVGEGAFDFHSVNTVRLPEGRSDLALVLDIPSTTTIVYYSLPMIVTLDANGGTVSPESFTGINTHPYGELPVPMRDGYLFVGWSYEGEIITADSIISNINDHTLVAQWGHRVTFDANGGVGGWSEVIACGENIQVPVVSREGYTFIGWSPEVVATVPANDVTYVAQWTPIKYTVTFDANGGVGGGSIQQVYGTAIFAPEVSRVGYTFKGWSPSVDATVPANDVAYTAQWQKNRYVVTFDANGGEGGKVETLEYGAGIVAPVVTRVGYTFNGWTPTVTETVTASDVTFKAQWEINKYNVTFDANGGSGGWSEEREYGATITAPTVMRDGYVFDGWSPTVASTVPSNDITYVAQWVAQWKEVESEPEEPDGAGAITFGDTYWLKDLVWSEDGWREVAIRKTSFINAYTGPESSSVGNYALFEVVGATSKDEIRPVVENLGFKGTVEASVWSDEELRQKASRGNWESDGRWIDNRAADDISGPFEFIGNTWDYNCVREYESDDAEWEWPRDLWPSNRAVADRFWVAVKCTPSDKNRWYGIDGCVRVWQAGTREESSSMYISHSTDDTLCRNVDVSKIFRGFTIQSQVMAFDPNLWDALDASYDAPLHGIWLRSGVVQPAGALSIYLPEAGILYMESNWLEELEDISIEGADQVTSIDIWEARPNESYDPEIMYFEYGAAVRPISHPNCIAATVNSAKTITLTDDDDDFDFNRLQFFPSGTKAVAVEASYFSISDKNQYPRRSGVLGEYLQGYVTGTGVYKVGETVELTAVPAPGEEFDHWEFKYGEFPEGIATNQQTLSFVVTDACAGTAEERKQMVVKAVWKEKHQLIGTPNDIDMGSVTGSGMYHNGENVTLTAIPEEGFRFLKWSDDVSTAERNVPVDGDAEFVAIFQLAANIATITFDANGGEVSEQSREVVNGDAIGELPTPTRSGYVFDGWWTAVDGGEQVLVSTIVAIDATYYAHWSENPLSSLTEGLVAYYPFDGNANDASGNGNNGVVYGATLTADRFGNANSAYCFGDDKYIFVADNASIHGLTDYSVSAWVRVDKWYGNWASIICKGTGSVMEYGLQLRAREYYCCWYDDIARGSVRAESSLPIGAWVHVAVSRSDGVVSAYLNGELMGVGSRYSLPSATSGALEIGRDIPGAIEYFYGAMDDLRLYNRALSAAEVKALYDSMAVPPNEPSGITLGDPYCYVDWTKSGDDGALWCREHWDWTDCWADAEDWAVVPINGATDDDELTPVIVYGSADESMVSEVCIEDEATFKARFKSNIEYDIGHTHTDPNYIKSFVSSRKWLIAKISYKAEKITPKTFFIGLKGGSEYRKFVIVWNHSDGAIEDGYDDTSETVVLPLPVGSASVSNNGLGARTVTVTPNTGYAVTGWSDDETNTSKVRKLQPGKSPYYVTIESEPVQYDETVQYEYEYDSEFSGIVLTDYSGTVPSSLTLPSEIDGQPVVGIGESFMEECDDIVSLTFPDTIRFIGNGAFSWSANIASINMNEGLERIGYDVFDGLQSLEELVIPSTVVSIDRDSFNYSGLGGGGIRSISIRGGDNSYFSADGGMLYDKLNRTVITACANIESAVIPSDCTVIGSEAFAGCSALVSVAFPESLTYMGGCVFDGCTSLEEVDLSETCVTEIANGAFLSCTSLTEVKMPATLARVGAYLFGGAKLLSKVVYLGNAPQIDTNFGWSYDDIADNAPYFPNGDMYVDYGGEYDSSYLEWITLDRRLTGVVSYVKKGTEGWGEVPGTWQGCPIEYLYEEPTPIFTIEDGVLTHVELNGVTEVVIPDGVVEIASHFMEQCTEVVSVTIPEGVARIDEYAFRKCDALRNVVLPSTIQYIGEKAFTRSVDEFDFHEGGITNIVIAGGDNSYLSSSGGMLYDKVSKMVIMGCPDIVRAELPSDCRRIGNEAFLGCRQLSEIVWPGTLEEIGDEAFARARIRSADLSGTSLRVVNEQAFVECEQLEEVKFPATLKTLGSHVFGVCDALAKVTYYGNAPTIDNSAEETEEGFPDGDIYVTVSNDSEDDAYVRYIDGVTTYVKEGSTGWGVVPGTWQGCPIEYLYEEPTPIFTIEDGVLTHVELNGATEVVIPDSVTSIGKGVFLGCSSLTSVTIPASVTSIGDSAFSGCTGLTSVTMDNVDNIEFGVECFMECPAYERPLYRMVFGGGAASANEVALTVTNVVVHYVTTSVQSSAVTPAQQTGLVNIIAEVTSGGPVAISSTWAEQYGDAFTAKFGNDFTVAITKPTGKRDGAGNAMLVWQDFVAGTDPTDEDDVFKADIAFDASGNPVISWTPELSGAETAKRTYRKFGKVKLNDAEWAEIPEGKEGDYNFFKVSVEMK